MWDQEKYSGMNQWQDSTIAYFYYKPEFGGRGLSAHDDVQRPSCYTMSGQKSMSFTTPYGCSVRRGRTYAVCELQTHVDQIPSALELNCSHYFFNLTTTPRDHVICPRNHVTHVFLACDPHAACSSANDVSFGRSSESWALPSKHCANVTSAPPSFTCASGEEYVPYTLICDLRQDCMDESDEDFCVFPACKTNQFQCISRQCVPAFAECDGVFDCYDITDERLCSKLNRLVIMDQPSIVTLNGLGSFTHRSLGRCPDTHFMCLSDDLCLPVYVRCNGVHDCPEKEDEAGCDDVTPCPGFYRCRGPLNTYLHPENLCDGWAQCLQHDDELLCNLTCPAQCSCLGHSWFCRQPFLATLYPLIRFLDARSSSMKPRDFVNNTLLIHLSLSNCSVVNFQPLRQPNLKSLDLTDNRIRIVTETDLDGLPGLNVLFLSGNPLTSVFSARTKPTLSFPKLTQLDLSDVKMRSINSSLLAPFPNLQILNLFGCGIEKIARNAFQSLTKLRVLDIRGCRLGQFPSGAFKGLKTLRVLRADNFKMCCPVTLPDGYDLNDCESPKDKVSSCSDLFKSNLHRVFWSLATSLALLCNVTALVKRLPCLAKPSSSVGSRTKSAASAFVPVLFACGCVHAVYLTIISLADVSYRGKYALEDRAWKDGSVCSFAGFLWILSTEACLFIVGLATLDRVLIFWCRVPLGFCRKSAVLAIFVVLVKSTVIALVPFFPTLSQGEMFQQTALCSPLLLSNYNFPGGHYFFGVFSVFNVTFSWLVALGKLSVYVCLHRNRFAFVQTPGQTNELSTTRRVMALVLCDVVYWLVIGHSRHIAAVSDNVVSLVQVVVLPFSWALKPVMFAAITLLEHRRRDEEERMLKMLIAKRHDPTFMTMHRRTGVTPDSTFSSYVLLKLKCLHITISKFPEAFVLQCQCLMKREE